MLARAIRRDRRVSSLNSLRSRWLNKPRRTRWAGSEIMEDHKAVCGDAPLRYGVSAKAPPTAMSFCQVRECNEAWVVGKTFSRDVRLPLHWTDRLSPSETCAIAE